MFSEGTKQRLSIVIELSKTVFHYGFIPTVLYLGKLTCNLIKTAVYWRLYIVSGFKKGSDPGMPTFSVAK